MFCSVALNSCYVQFVRTPGKTGSHFNPNSDVFLPNEKKDVLTSTASWLAMIGVLAGLTFAMGPLKMLKLYAIPYVVGAACLHHTCNFVTLIIRISHRESTLQ
jgi:fatty acid desaturase